jgi:hypothetical protein
MHYDDVVLLVQPLFAEKYRTSSITSLILMVCQLTYPTQNDVRSATRIYSSLK